MKANVFLYNWVITSLLSSLVIFTIFSCTPEKETSKPNFVIIMADDLGYGGTGSYGNTNIATPHLDSMAERGLRFTDYHSNGAVCTPTRAAMVTGRYQQRSGLEGVIYVQGETRKTGMDPGETTFADILQKAGYATGIMGKWHLGYRKKFNPVHQGFDQFYGFVSGNIDYHSHYDNAGIYDWWHNTDSLYEEGYSTYLITDHAVDFIKANKEQPFSLFINHEAPHVPFQGPDDEGYRYPDKDFSYWGPREDRQQAYYEMVEAMDKSIGRVMNTLKDLGLAENTLVFFCSDNGAIPEYGNNGNLRGDKGSLWEGGHRVPAIAYWEDHIQPGVTDATVMSFDLFPTMVNLAGVESDPALNLDGVDLTAHLTDDAALPQRSLFWRYRGQQAVRKGPWKLMMTEEDTLLFNLSKDLSEANDLKTDYPDTTRMMIQQYNRWKNDVLKGVDLKTD